MSKSNRESNTSVGMDVDEQEEPLQVMDEVPDEDIPDDDASIDGDDIADEDLIDANEDEDERAAHALAKQQQKEKLAQIQAQLDSDNAAGNRLNYLMRQSEVFAHFLTAGGDSAVDLTKIGSSSNGKGRKGKGRMREDEEDKLMLKAANSQIKSVRLLKQPSIVKGEMRPYQLEGLNWMIKLYDNNINGILADEMGLGKTLQTISLIAYLREARKVNGPHLIIVPKSVCSNWMREFKRWCPEVRTVKLQGSKEERAHIVKNELVAGKFDAAIVSYESLLKESSCLLRFRWKYCIIDEAHRIKNENSSLSKMLRKVKCDFRLLITGTPLQNNLHELWALLNFLLPEVFNEADKFDKWFNTEDEAATNNVVKRLHTVLQPFLLRRVKADVDSDIPPKTETKLYIGMSELQRDWYSKVITKDVASLNVLAQGQLEKSRLMNMLMQLRKCTNHPYLFDGAEPGPPYFDGPHLWENSGKMVLLDKLLVKLKSQGSRVLIFSQMTRMLDILEDYLLLKNRSGCDYGYCRIDGNTSGERRDDMMDTFNAPNSAKFCFLLSTRAGGLGINLQTADIVILYDSDWNPQVDLQAMDRAHRIGQTKPVRVFRFITEKTVEEKIIERADKKLFLDAAVIQQGRLAANTQLSSSELMSMCRFGADEIINTKGAMMTDEDIDALLSKGEERTKEMSAKISEHMQHNLANFSISMDKEEIDLLSFDTAGEDGVQDPGFISLPTRERKRNYDVDEYFRDALLAPSADDEEEGDADPDDGYVGQIIHREKKGVPGTMRMRKFNRIKYPNYQFYDERINEIQDIEEQIFEKKRHQRMLIKKLRIFCPGFRIDTIPAAVVAGLIDGKTEDGLEIVEGCTVNDIPRLDEEVKAPEGTGKFALPADLQKEKDEIIARSFHNWSRADFKIFVRAVEQYGCLDNDELKERAVSFVIESIDKDRSEVERYYDVFRERYEGLELGARSEASIIRGNKKAIRAGEVQALLKQKMENIGGKVMYSGGTKGKFFSEENDCAILYFMYIHGYGNWDIIQKALRQCKMFQFDWFIQSRRLDEIQRRGDKVVRFIQKEVEKWNAKKEKAIKDYKEVQELLEGASQEAMEQSDLEDLQHRVTVARNALANAEERSEFYGTEIIIPQYTPEQMTEKLNTWNKLESERIAKTLAEKKEEEPLAVTPNSPTSAVPESSSSPIAEQELKIEPYEGPITACVTISTDKKHVRTLNVQSDHSDLSIESAMRHIKRVGGVAAIAPPAGQSSKGVKRKLGEESVAASSSMVVNL
jgi:SWI/SNF-related matrix-associated actin-dependent regulator of chromatin subfamily A member 5